MRTIPPYLAALMLSWTAVYAVRREPFDFGYLLFLQNYYDALPFFLVSWSLCVEEHFYLLAPLALLLLRGPYRRAHLLLFAVVFLVPLIGRTFISPEAAQSFGFANTATHLHMSGLVFGAALSYMAVDAKRDFGLVLKASPYVIIGSLGCLIFLETVAPMQVKYIFWETVIAIFFSAVLVFVASLPEMKQAVSRIVYPIAIASYSTYLIHPLALHVASGVTLWLPATLAWLYFPIAFTFVAAASAAFYFAFERTAILLRDRLCPRRGRAISLEPTRVLTGDA